jgi:hypothetical protein
MRKPTGLLLERIRARQARVGVVGLPGRSAS